MFQVRAVALLFSATLASCSSAGAAFAQDAIAFAQDAPRAFVGARIIPIEGDPIDPGVMVVQGGKITALGPVDSTEIPAGSVRHDVSGQVLMPGLICTHSHVGGGSGGDRSEPIQPECRILDAINVRSPSIQKAQAGGITVANVMPGSGHLISGQTLYLKFRDGGKVDDLLILDEEGHIAGGLKMANGTNSRRNPPFPGTRAKSAALVRARYVKAQEYRDQVARAAGDPDKLPARDLALEVLVEAMQGTRIVHHHTHRHDDIVTVLRLADEFGFRVVLHHVSDGWKVAEEIAAAGAPCSVIVIDAPGGKLEAKDNSLETGKILDEAGVLVGFHTDDPITDSRLFLRSAALAHRAGMSKDKALYALTLAGAIMLDLQDRVGSLKVGKDADFILLSGDPLSVYTKVTQTWVDGEKVFDLSDPRDRLLAVGGYGAGNEEELSLCCYDR